MVNDGSQMIKMARTVYPSPPDLRSDAQKKTDDEEFKLEVKRETEYAEKRKNAVKVGQALDTMRSKVNLSVFRGIQTNSEQQNACKESLVVQHWLSVKFGFNLKKAIEEYEKDGKRFSERIYNEALKKVK